MKGDLGGSAEFVERVVRERVIDQWEAQDLPPHLKTIRDRLLRRGEERMGRLLGVYQQVLAGEDGIAADESEEQLELRLTGLVVKRQGRLRLYNRIYGAVFDGGWVDRALGELRPYGAAIAAWLASGGVDESRLLRGQALQDARGWAEGKRLGDDDYRFLDASQEVERREMQTLLAAEQEANQILTAAREQAETELAEANQQLGKVRRWTIASGAGAIAAVVVAAIAVPSSFMAKDAQKKAETRMVQARAQKDALQIQSNQLTVKLTETEQKEKDAQQKAQAAQQQYKAAQQKEKAARIQASKAAQQATAAQQQATAAQQQVAQAAQQLIQVKQTLSSAQRSINVLKNQADVLENQAQVSEKQAQVAQIASLLEREAATLASESDTLLVAKKSNTEALPAIVSYVGELQYLIHAVQIGQRLKEILPTSAAQLGDYPASSPIWTLQQLLQRIHERNQFDHPDRVLSVAFSPSGQEILTASQGTVWVRKRSSNSPITLEHGGSIVLSTDFSPNGERIVTSTDNSLNSPGKVVVWRHNGEKINELQHSSPVRVVKFHPLNSQQVVTGSDDGIIQLWDNIDSQAKSTTFVRTDVKARLITLDLSSDGKQIVAVYEDGKVILWDTSKKNLSRIINIDAREVSSVGFNPKNTEILLGYNDGKILIKNLDSDSSTAIQGHTQKVTHIEFSNDGQKLLSSSFDGTVIVRTIDERGEMIESHRLIHQTDPNHASSVQAYTAKFNRANSNEILAAFQDGKAILWDLKGTRVLPETTFFDDSKDNILSIDVSPNQQTLATVTRKNINLWNLKRNSIQPLPVKNGGDFKSILFSSNKELLVADDDKVRILNLADNSHRILERPDMLASVPITSINFVERTGEIIAAYKDGITLLWEPNKGPLIFKRDDTFGRLIEATSISTNLEGNKFLVGYEDGVAILWDREGKFKKVCNHLYQANQSPIYSSFLGSDLGSEGYELLLGLEKQVVLCHSNGTISKVLPHDAIVTNVRFSQDKKLILTTTSSGTINIWNASGGQLIQIFQSLPIRASYIHPNATKVLTTTNNRVNLWMTKDMNIDWLLQSACSWLEDYIETDESRKQLEICLPDK